MKKLLLSILCILGMVSYAAADEVTIVCSELFGTATGTLNTTPYNVDSKVSLTFDKATGSNQPGINKDGTARLYAKNTLVIAGLNGYEITSIAFTAKTANNIAAAGVTCDNGTFTGDTLNCTTSVESVKFTKSSATTQFQFSKVVITCVKKEVAVEKPVFSVPAGSVLQDTEVEITCATAGASIYYTVDGSEPTTSSTLYTDKLTIVKDVTIKAIAVKGNDKSAVATATYTVVEEKTLAEVNGLKSGSKFIMDSDLLVTYENSADNRYVYVKDNNADVYGLIYKSGLGLKAGYVIKKGWVGSVSVYGGLVELVPNDATLAKIDSVSVPNNAKEVTDYKSVTQSMVNSFVVLKNVSFDAATPATAVNFKGVMGTDTIAFRNTFKIASQNKGSYNVKSIVSYYNGLQIVPIEYEAITVTPSAPVFNPSSGTVAAGTEVSITCATAGASIVYTLDGTEPGMVDGNLNGTTYTAPIKITEDLKINAVAILNGIQSEVVTGRYRVADANTAVFNWSNPASLVADSTVVAPEDGNGCVVNNFIFTNNKVNIKFEKGSASTDCRIWNTKGVYDVRTYNKSSFTVSCASGYIIESIVITGNKTAATSITPSTGSVGGDSNTVNWFPTENVNEVTFAVTATFQMSNTVVKIAEGTPTGVDVVAAEEGEAVYFNLQGVKVAEPVNGIFIEVRGGKATKVIK